jgi:predicted Zn-dependent protease
MKEAFFTLADMLCGEAHADETLLCNLSAERSDFVRFNHGLVRQAGTVTQRVLGLRLIRGRRQAQAAVALAGTADDLALARHAIAQLRDIVRQLPEDPWLALPDVPHSTTDVREGSVPVPEAVVDHVVAATKDLDFVGFYAGGTMYRGHASSLGQRNWHAVTSFSLDWSLYLAADKAVKVDYAGYAWEPAAFDAKLAQARSDLALLAQPPRSLAPGAYRAFLAPQAMEELLGLLSWGGFSARARETRQSPLLRMTLGETLAPKVTLVENTAEGAAPGFQGEGYPRPPRVPLVLGGRLAEALVSPRSAKEYSLATNGASGREAPESLDMAAGTLAQDDILAALGDGLYVSNLWYLNYSDRAAGRITGMTRFATFLVERGRIVAPVNVMRFDDAIYNMLGANLVDLTREREFLLDRSTYEERSTASARLPGALLSSLALTL